VASTGQPKAELLLTDQARAQLFRWSSRARSAHASRSRIVLGCRDGQSNSEVTADLSGEILGR
jgi:hypothetical protein